MVHYNAEHVNTIESKRHNKSRSVSIFIKTRDYWVFNFKDVLFYLIQSNLYWLWLFEGTEVGADQDSVVIKSKRTQASSPWQLPCGGSSFNRSGKHFLHLKNHKINSLEAFTDFVLSSPAASTTEVCQVLLFSLCCCILAELIAKNVMFWVALLCPSWTKQTDQ